MKLTLLGTGTPAPSLRRAGSGYVIDIGNDLLVFDHGPGAHQRFLEAGFQAKHVTHVFLSHYHYDHFVDFPRLALTRWDHGAGMNGPLKVYGPEPLDQIMGAFFADTGSFGPDIDARTHHPGSISVYHVRGGTGERPGPQFEPRSVAPGDVIEGTGWTIRVGRTWHSQPQIESLCFRIESGGKSIVYAGDGRSTYEPLIEFCKDADVAILMNHWLTGKEPSRGFVDSVGTHMENARLAHKANVKTVVLTHLQPGLDRVGVKEQMLLDMYAVYTGRIIIGEDKMELPTEFEELGISD